MKLYRTIWPDVTLRFPDTDNANRKRAYSYIAESIADRLAESRGGKLDMEIISRADWLGARVGAEPALARRERQLVQSVVARFAEVFHLAPPRPERTRRPQQPRATATAINRSLLSDLLPPPATVAGARAGPRSVKVFDLEALDASLAALKALPRDSETRNRLQATLERIRALGPDRERSTPVKTWQAACRSLALEFPNFSEVIEQAVRPHLALLSAGAARPRMPPLLLVGPPGIGKTLFARRLGDVLGASTVAVDMAASTNGAELAGSSTFWANSAPGIVLTTLGWGAPGQRACADPIVLVDEVDKVSADRYDPIGALYSLLEQASAQRFEDQSVPGLAMDAGLIRWVLTANDSTLIPAPIRSRTLRFDISAPTAEELTGIARRTMSRIVDDLGLKFDKSLPGEIAAAASAMSPREVSLRLEVAIGNALSVGRRHMKGADWIGATPSASRSRRIGFV